MYVSNVAVEYESGEMDAVSWAESDEGVGPDDPVNGESVEISIGRTDLVTIEWRRDGHERVIQAWAYDDDGDRS